MKMDVWIEGRDAPVGRLERAGDKSLSFTYADDVPAEHEISMSLPIATMPHDDAACRGYFGNLLFEGPQLERVLDGFGIDRGDIGAQPPIQIAPHAAGQESGGSEQGNGQGFRSIPVTSTPVF